MISSRRTKSSSLPAGCIARRFCCSTPASGKQVKTLARASRRRHALAALAWSDDGKFLAAGYECEVMVWDVASGRNKLTIRPAEISGMECAVWRFRPMAGGLQESAPRPTPLNHAA